MSLLLRAAVDVDLDNCSHCSPPKFRQGLVYSLHKSGWGQFVGVCHEITEPSELGLPLGERNFVVFFLGAAYWALPASRIHRRCAFTPATRMADGLMKGRNLAISFKA